MFFFQRLRVTRASDPLAPLRSLEHAGIPFFGDMNPQRAKRSYDASRSRRLTKVFFCKRGIATRASGLNLELKKGVCYYKTVALVKGGRDLKQPPDTRSRRPCHMLTVAR